MLMPATPIARVANAEASEDDASIWLAFFAELASANPLDKMEFVVALLAPLGVPLHMLRLYGRKRNWRSLPFITRVVIFLLLAVVLAGTAFLPLHGFLWWGAAVLVNLLSLLVIALFSGSFTELAGSIRAHSRKIDGLIGEQIWAGKTTTALLRDLNTPQRPRARWVFVNFLKEVVDDVISQNAVYQVKTCSPWTQWNLCRYSLFLSENIEHAKTVWWLVAPKDFFYVLLPDFIAYSLSCYGWMAHRYPLNLPDSRQTALGDVFARQFGAAFVPSLTEILVDLRGDSDALKLNEVREKVLPVQAQLGIRALVEGCLSGLSGTFRRSGLRTAYLQCFPAVLDSLLPHVEAFRLCRAAKMRVIYLGDQTDLKVDRNLGDLLQRQFDVGQFLRSCSSVCQDDLRPLIASGAMPRVARTAMRLFAYTCGGATHCQVATLSGEEKTFPGDLTYPDVGIYDSTYVVRSRPARDDDPKGPREVAVSYYPPGAGEPPEARFFAPANGTTRRSYPTFVKVFLRVLNEKLIAFSRP